MPRGWKNFALALALAFSLAREAQAYPSYVNCDLSGSATGSASVFTDGTIMGQTPSDVSNLVSAGSTGSGTVGLRLYSTPESDPLL